MKIRAGFVSNSSSSSFVIKKNKINATQIEQIRNHIEEGKKNGVYHSWGKIGDHYVFDGEKIQTSPKNNDAYDAWKIKETNTEISGSTIQDSFSMEDFFDKIGVKEEDIEWWCW